MLVRRAAGSGSQVATLHSSVLASPVLKVCWDAMQGLAAVKTALTQNKTKAAYKRWNRNLSANGPGRSLSDPDVQTSAPARAAGNANIGSVSLQGSSQTSAAVWRGSAGSSAQQGSPNDVMLTFTIHRFDR